MPPTIRKGRDMTELDLNPTHGVFDPAAISDMADAFEKAERHLDRLRSSALGGIDRDRVARKIVHEARGGETQPDLVWRAAVARVLLEAHAVAARPTEGSATTSSPPPKRRTKPTGAAAMPPAGPHAMPRQTNEHATPGSGALPAEGIGNEVDPATG